MAEEKVLSEEEYQKIYDDETAKLDAGAEPDIEKDPITPDPDDDPLDKKEPEKEPDKKEPDPDKKEEPNPLELRLEKAEKALKDTQTWGHNNAAEIKKLRKERDALIQKDERAKNRPEILDDDEFSGLEEAIEFVAGKPGDDPDDEKKWSEVVGEALPDIEKMLDDDAFRAKANEVRESLGADWDNPLIAVRELGKLREEVLRDAAVTKAVEAARVDFAKKKKGLDAMALPGGTGKNSPKAPDSAKEVENMSDAEFEKEREKVLGYN